MLDKIFVELDCIEAILFYNLRAGKYYIINQII